MSILRTTIELVGRRSPTPQEQHALAMREVDAVLDRMTALPERSRVELRKKIEDVGLGGLVGGVGV